MAQPTLKEGLLSVVLFLHQADDVLEDGRISFKEGIQSIEHVRGLVKNFRYRKEYIKQYRALDSQGKRNLLTWFEQKLDLESDKAEAIVEKSVALLVAFEDLLAEF